MRTIQISFEGTALNFELPDEVSIETVESIAHSITQALSAENDSIAELILGELSTEISSIDFETVVDTVKQIRATTPKVQVTYIPSGEINPEIATQQPPFSQEDQIMSSQDQTQVQNTQQAAQTMEQITTADPESFVRDLPEPVHAAQNAGNDNMQQQEQAAEIHEDTATVAKETQQNKEKDSKETNKQSDHEKTIAKVKKIVGYAGAIVVAGACAYKLYKYMKK